MSEDGVVVDLYCTLCFHDLNHHAYHIHSHPILDVAVCECCYEDISEIYHHQSDKKLSSSKDPSNPILADEMMNEESKSETLADLCIWCFQDNDAFLCDKCNRNVCKACVRDNFYQSTVYDIEATDPWLCYSCNQEPIKHLQTACHQGQAISIYNDGSKVFERIRSEIEADDQKVVREEYIVDGHDLYYDIFRLRVLFQEENLAGHELDDSSLEEVRRSIMTEIRLRNDESNFSES
jgi:hypothetical protein